MMTENENYLAMAQTGCVHCNGLGMRSEHVNALKAPCNCVLRSIFRACFNRFKVCAAGDVLRPISVDGNRGPKGRAGGRGRKQIEYMADFVLVSRKSLDPFEYQLFKFHYLLGADWKLCCQRLHIDRGNFFHAVYRIQQKLGHVFHTLEPYPLYPLHIYFSDASRGVKIHPSPVPAERYANGRPLIPPIAPRLEQPPAPDPYEVLKEEIRLAYSQGQGLTAIARDLNSRGVLPKRALRWYPSIVRTVILQAPREQATLSRKAA